MITPETLFFAVGINVLIYSIYWLFRYFMRREITQYNRLGFSQGDWIFVRYDKSMLSYLEDIQDSPPVQIIGGDKNSTEVSCDGKSYTVNLESGNELSQLWEIASCKKLPRKRGFSVRVVRKIDA